MNHTFKSNKLNKETKSDDVKKLEAALRGVKGVQSVTPHSSRGTIEVSYGTEVKDTAIMDAAKNAGFPLQQSER